MDQSKVVGRLAPSPTGALHLGHARTFLIAWLSARQAGGRVVLRIEDLDASRIRDWAVALAITDLRWLGLDWDGPLIYQSQRTGFYAHALEHLKARQCVYPCTCTRADRERAASAPHAGEGGPAYPGTCAGRDVAAAGPLAGRPFAWRFRLPPGPIGWDDLIRGAVVSDPARAGGDFIVARSTGEYAYQLAVVVDDAAQGVTEVIRGDDLVDSTPRQILIYQALGLPQPRFGHLPLAVGPDGRRLAKRDESIKLVSLRESGVDPRRLVGWIAQSCGLSPQREPSWPRDWIGRLDLRALPTTPWVADPATLNTFLD